MMNQRFPDKVVLVTGAGHGIGRQIAIDFAAEGAKVGVNDVDADRARTVADEIVNNGGRAIDLPADVRIADEVRRMVDTVASELGTIDILVNNAGIYPNTLVVEMSEEEWDSVWDINVKGMFLVSRAVARQMIAAEKSGGKFVNVSSTAALRARIGAAHYCSSKAAISMFTKVLAMELAEYKINVNAVAPGLIEVPDWGLAPEYIQTMVDMTPWRRIGYPEDISNVVRFLASDEADFMTGSIVVSDGGVAVGQNLPLS
jgi:3-oxoacyl-[acyl-carrier protein] reductase